MKIPLSWIKDFVEIDLPIEELVRQLTMAGLEVEEIIFVGLPKPSGKVARRQRSLALNGMQTRSW